MTVLLYFCILRFGIFVHTCVLMNYHCAFCMSLVSLRVQVPGTCCLRVVLEFTRTGAVLWGVYHGIPLEVV